jgi:hypothetical protein
MRVMVMCVVMVMVVMARECGHGHQDHCHEKQRQQLFHAADYSGAGRSRCSERSDGEPDAATLGFS